MSTRDAADSFTLAAFNQLSDDAIAQALMSCCQCRGWAQRVTIKRPFLDAEALRSVITDAWAQATEAELLEAFQGHPQIGDLQALRNKFQGTATAEQGQVEGANESVLRALQARNDTYRERFGFIFIVYATGKSAAQMLALLDERLLNSRPQELGHGAAEQLKITMLRIDKLVSECVAKSVD
ncbi:MAG: 2-oxo-4-hydroxy-4-carboxy-5-ureidoimidazoline decarboxylase [Candidatus Pseudothioglobus sp.]